MYMTKMSCFYNEQNHTHITQTHRYIDQHKNLSSVLYNTIQSKLLFWKHTTTPIGGAEETVGKMSGLYVIW